MTFRQVLEKHLATMTQAELGAALGLPQDKAQKYISMWRRADANSNIEKQWKLFKRRPVVALLKSTRALVRAGFTPASNMGKSP
jgi:transcriptional regulator with XRE-family HTH domain